MRNLTLAVDEDILIEARKLALERNTSVNELVRCFLAQLVLEQGQRSAALARLQAHMAEGLYAVGGRSWTRDELHDR